MGILIFPYLLSQYVWLIILSILFIGIIPIKIPQTTKDFFSFSTESKWNSSKKPFWLMHVTDLHISSSKPNSYETIYSRLSEATQILKPQKIIISGDITDNSINTSSFRPNVKMVEDDWLLFDKMIDELNLKNSNKLVFAAGNHDVYNIESFYSEKHYANDRIYNESTYEFNFHTFEPDPSEITIISTNPYEFPTPPNEMMNWVYPSSEYREKLVKHLQTSSSHYTILTAHHPVLHWYPTYATTKDIVLNEILLRSKNVRFYLSGHLHPDSPQFYHHGDTLEVVGTPLFKKNEVGLITFDNHRAAYHQIDLSKKPFGAITNPVPIDQTSNIDVFYEKDTELRVLVFSDKYDLNLVASGAVSAKLDCSFIDNGIQLCSYPMSLNSNIHSITISGDWSGSVNFTNANTATGYSETPYNADSSGMWIFLFSILYIFSLVMTIPINFVNVGEPFNKWINGRLNQSQWLFSIFGGFLAVKSRFQRATKLIKISLFLAMIWTICLPISFFDINGSISFLWVWGYFSVGKNIFTFYGMRFAVHFIIFSLFPIILFISSVEATKGLSKVFIFDIVIYILFAFGWIYTIYELTFFFGPLYSLTSPLITLIPIYLHIISIIYVIKTVKIEKQNHQAENAFQPIREI
ncbi:hypothetical protein TRFO_27254 [Tritrichomonas foetus]|uniref:Calcineurin-like phosphoesterase domain-containing protein n=1 Tax=Tritrichomonas foetus TaxID=1144522 RepID=A0A1J4K5W4_9EUKA|nr:hypothetical protein TRFO_27254 [Tritrichomonas foetus]|eukprot:OHT05124.1 hypothetical protein TRFO_27254 [Tritrichomonas foetus]